MGAHELPANAVKIVNMQPNNMVIALARGDVDALCWDPLTVQAAVEQSGGKVGVLDTSDSKKYFRQYCLMVGNEAFVKSRPDACDGIVAALQSAIGYIRDHPSDAVQIMSKRSKITPQQSEEALADFTREIRFDEVLMGALLAQSDWAIDNKLAVRPAQDLRAMYRGLMYVEGAKKAIPGSVELSA
jgi:ABC-type nitrate/sulfonate/bicarbonate transport system substrate-binding protein